MTIASVAGGRPDWWYLSWIPGAGLALALAVLNAMWYEMRETDRGRRT